MLSIVVLSAVLLVLPYTADSHTDVYPYFIARCVHSFCAVRHKITIDRPIGISLVWVVSQFGVHTLIYLSRWRHMRYPTEVVLKSCNIKTRGISYGLCSVLSYRVSEQCSLIVSAQVGEETIMPRIKLATKRTYIVALPKEVFATLIACPNQLYIVVFALMFSVLEGPRGYEKKTSWALVRLWSQQWCFLRMIQRTVRMCSVR